MTARILVVDDDARLARVVATALVLEGYRVGVATSAVEALQDAARTPPDLVILDVMMDGIDGIAACRLLRGNPATRSIPVLMFTALSDGQHVEAARAAGANHLITKPFDLSGLRALVAYYVKGREAAVN